MNPPMEIEARMKRLLDQLENESLSEVGIARIERKLTILRKLQEEEGQES